MDLVDLKNEFRAVVDHCRAEISKNEGIIIEDTLYYAVMRMYCRVLLSCCEIFILLKEGYPHGALSLSRQVYEGLVIIDVLLKAEKDGDEKMPERFLDAAEISELQYYIDMADMLKNDDSSNEKAQNSLRSLIEELNEVTSKYPDTKNISDYWWANCWGFNKLSDKSQFQKGHMYKFTCMNTHLNAYSAIEYLDNNKCIVIGEMDDGFEMPIWYTSLCLTTIVAEINGKYPNLCPDCLMPELKKLTEDAAVYVRDSNYKRLAKLGIG